MFVINPGAKAAYIYFSHYCEDDRARVSMGIKVKKGSKGIDREALKKSERMLLNRVEDAVTKHIESCARVQAPLLKAETETVVNQALGRLKHSKHGFEADYIQMLKDMEDGKMLHPKKKTRYSPHTVGRYAECLKMLKRFSAEEKKPLTYNLNVDWVNALIVWMSKPCTKERKFRGNKSKMVEWSGYAQNTIANTMRYLTAFLGHMYGKKHNSLFFKHSVFSIPDEETDAEALSIDEINAIYTLHLDSAALDRARDITVFGSWVGLRAEDLENINDYKLKGKNFEFFNQKNGETVIIPAHPKARAIWEKYGGNMPVIAKPNLRMYMGKVCKAAGLTEQCMITITRGGVKRVEYYEKWQLITPHSLRRTFATNAVKAGIQDRKVMLFTGHTTETSFRKYLRLKKKENAAELADHSFFNS